MSQQGDDFVSIMKAHPLFNEKLTYNRLPLLVMKAMIYTHTVLQR